MCIFIYLHNVWFLVEMVYLNQHSGFMDELNSDTEIKEVKSLDATNESFIQLYLFIISTNAIIVANKYSWLASSVQPLTGLRKCKAKVLICIEEAQGSGVTAKEFTKALFVSLLDPRLKVLDTLQKK